jgi:DNA-binding NarL/FixJ family response regulator
MTSMTGAPTIRLLLVDARALMRAALGGLLQTRPEFRLLGDAGTP